MARLTLSASSRLDLATRRRAYAGDVLVFHQLPSLIALCAYFEAKWSADAAPLVTAEHGEEGCERQRRVLCCSYEEDACVSELWTMALREAGVDTQRTAWDRVRLRVQQSGGTIDAVDDAKFATGRFSSTLPLHRDTWASNVRSQLNCWTPLRPLAAGRTMALYPTYFERAVPNTSASWDFFELRRSRRGGGDAAPYPQLPAVDCDALAQDDALRAQLEADAAPLLVAPGDLVIFSGAHLHKSVVNRSGEARFSSEVRLVSEEDEARERAGEASAGAPNVDGAAPRRTPQWFSGIDSGVRLDRIGAATLLV